MIITGSSDRDATSCTLVGTYIVIEMNIEACCLKTTWMSMEVSN